MTVKLFKNSKVDGLTRLGNWSSLSEQVSYFDTLTYRLYSNVPTVRLGDPLRIKDNFNNLLNYGYGYIDYGNGFRYYFIVADLTMVTETLTDISYTIDVYTTAKFQTNMKIKRATISRYPTSIGKMVNPFSEDYTKRTKLSSYKQWNIVALFRDSTTDTTYTLINNSPDLTSVVDGSWLDDKYSATDIIAAGIVMDSWTNSELNSIGFAKQATSDKCWFYNGVPIINCHKLFTDTITNDGTTWHEITDLKGNTIFTVPYKTELSCGAGVVDISASSINLRFNLIDSNTSTTYILTIPGETPTVIADAWNEYYLRQRSIDSETRNLQMNQQLMTGLASTATSMASGAVMGGIGGMGAGAGAGVSGAGGLLSTLGNYAISAYYSPKQQAIIDKSYKYANDTICMVGGVSAYIYTVNAVVGVVKVEWDDQVKTAYENDITNNGYYVNYATDDFDSMIVNGPIQATVEVQGDIPVVWKEQITNRFANGVYMV